MMQLYGYYRSSASYRVRIALNLKGLTVEHIPVDLLKEEQKTAEYSAINPQQLVPALVTGEGALLSQSLAIMEYLEECYPNAASLLPKDATGRARVRALAQAIACEIAPLNNLRVLGYLTGKLGLTEEQKVEWYRHWIATGFAALEDRLQETETESFCHGETPTMADCCLVPQVYNARRFECDLRPYPTIRRIAENCEALSAFAAAHPSNYEKT